MTTRSNAWVAAGICLFFYVAVFSVGAGAMGEPAASDMKPFPVTWGNMNECRIDFSYLLTKPAGKAGFITVRDGHLATADGNRIRFWGVNLSGKGCLPPKEHAEAIAERLARWGVNCVRFHFFDRPAPNGIIDATRDDTRRLDPEYLDRLDYLVAQLKARGIYSDINLNVARSYKAGDGVRDYELLGFAKGLTYFDPRLLELQREYARALLTHKNPYTGNEYRHEPAVALVELVNENSLVEAWMDGRLRGTNLRKNPGTWTDIPASYAADLTRLYNEWLAENVPPETLRRIREEAAVPEGERIPRLEPDQFSTASAERFHTEARFYMEVERGYFLSMRRLLRAELGVQSLIVGNSDHGHGHSGYPVVAGTSLLDVVDGHVYWQHPAYIRDAETGRTVGFKIPNTPMVVDPLHSTVAQLARTPVAGKPYTVSEVNHPFPHRFACEGIPILAAYGAFQDWDGIFWYTLAHAEIVGTEPRIASHFDLAFDPVKMTQLAACAAAFLRGDVRAAERTVLRSYSAADIRESIRSKNRWEFAPFFTPGLSAALPLKHAVRVEALESETQIPTETVVDNPILSDTGELAWRTEGKDRGVVAINTPRFQALIGYGRDLPAETDNMQIRLESEFAAITLSAVESTPIADAKELLLTTCGAVANAGQKWNADRTSLEDWGRAPTEIEVLQGSVFLKGITARGVKVVPLDADGRPLAEAFPARKLSGTWQIPLGEFATTWFLVLVDR
ncbi:MAG: hypothetical protein ACUVTW_01330 [Thermogutta sp.]